MRISEEYYSWVLFSASKYAKNYRDLERFSKEFKKLKRDFYEYKKVLLSPLEPVKLQVTNKKEYYALFALDGRYFHQPISESEFNELKEKHRMKEEMIEAWKSKSCKSSKLCEVREIQKLVKLVQTENLEILGKGAE